jgi:hypothetical protein
MPALSSLLNPMAYARQARRWVMSIRHWIRPNLRGADFFAPGHFHSPLLDIASLGAGEEGLPHDGVEMWEQVNLRPEAQRAFYEELLDKHPPLPFPADKAPASGLRYFTTNDWFAVADAFTLSGIIRKERPKLIIEIGSGFSSAVILDTLGHLQATCELTFIEPNPGRLRDLFSEEDLKRHGVTILERPVQEMPVTEFDRLEAGDVLFIDSSHVVKAGSDVSFLFLRVLPRLKPGVLVHVHDIFYPHSYPVAWIRLGMAWNESIFLRALLVGSPSWEVMAFNDYAAKAFPELWRARWPAFMERTGGSFWMRKRN